MSCKGPQVSSWKFLAECLKILKSVFKVFSKTLVKGFQVTKIPKSLLLIIIFLFIYYLRSSKILQIS